MSTSSASPTLKAAYDECQAITKREARNFYYAFVTLPRPRRRAIYAAYAFSRRADDIADGDAPAKTKRAAISDLRARLHDALTGGPADPIMTALADTSRTYDIPESLFSNIIDGVEMDLDIRRYETFDDLRAYCYKVASAVGLVSIRIFGYTNPKAEDYAVDLGLAMQLTNIIRDIREDAERDRVYLPLEDLHRFGYTEKEMKDGVINDAYLRLMAFQAERARRYFDSGSMLLPLLQRRSRACAAGLHHLYGLLLDRIEKQGFDVFSERVGLPAWQKLRLTVTLWAASLLPDRQSN
jgi:phytoene synthase